MSTLTRYFLYARKSTDQEDRQVYSIDHQRAELRKIAADKNLDIVAEFDESRTAKVPGGPIFNEMLRRIKNGEASGILSWSPDRVARNPIDGGQIIHMLDTGTLRDLQFFTCTYEPTSAGKLMLNVLFGMSKYFSDSLGDGVKRALRQRIQQGYWAKRPPLGYLFDRNTRTVVIDPVKGPLLRMMFQRYASGTFTLDHLTEFVNAQGLLGRSNRHHPPKPLARSQIYLLLQNPFFAGMMRLNGELYEGKHEPLISATLFDACQTVMAQRGLKRATGVQPFLYRGMFACGECGCAITLETQKGHRYLRCTKRKGPCSQPYLQEKEVARQIARFVARMAIPEDAANWMIGQFQDLQDREAALVSDEIRSRKAAVASYDQKLERLTMAFVDGTQSLEQYKKLKDKVLTEKHLLTDKLTFLERNRKSRFEPAVQFIRGLTEARIVAQGDDWNLQRNFLQNAGSNFTIRDKRVHWQVR